jgi:Tfp pilus tip-associated adhesin PilY1
MIVPGGYDPTKDYMGSYGVKATGDPNPNVQGRGPDASGNRVEDKVGNAVYIIDAVRGSLVARVRGTNTLPLNRDGVQITESALSNEITHADLKHSIAAAVTPIDYNGSGLIDRIYFVDVIGTVWRLDMNARDSDSDPITQNWVLSKIAVLGSDGASGSAVVNVLGTGHIDNDRRFFHPVDVVRTRRPDGTAVDALMVGSGNLAAPKETTVKNGFFMIYDANINPLTTALSTPFTLNDLMLATNPATDVANDKDGWYLPLTGEGEKTASASITVDGNIRFTTVIPGSSTEAGCAPPAAIPTNKLYSIDLHTPLLGTGTTITGSGLAAYQLDPYVNDEGKVSIILTDGTTETLGGGSRRLTGKDKSWHTVGQ